MERKRAQRRKITKSEEGVVLLFDDNKGEGVIRLKDGSRIKVHYRDIMRDSIFFLFEGEKVRVHFDDEGRVIKVDTL